MEESKFLEICICLLMFLSLAVRVAVRLATNSFLLLIYKGRVHHCRLFDGSMFQNNKCLLVCFEKKPGCSIGGKLVDGVPPGE